MKSFETLDYEGSISRPPSEARSIILQVTVGCSHNRCTFCVRHKNKRFRVKERRTVEADLDRAARLYPGVRRLFLTDGDALVMPMDEWHWLLPEIRRRLPWLERVGVYATGRAIHEKSDEDLRWLSQNGLGIVYLGVESGDDPTLAYVCKGSTAAELIDAGRRVKGAEMALSVTVLLGIAPPGRVLAHARETGRVLSVMDPDFVGVLSVLVCEGTPLAELVRRREHRVPTAEEYLWELREMLAETTMSRGYFMANHASNYLPVRIRMPDERAQNLALLDAALAGHVRLRPEAYRAL